VGNDNIAVFAANLDRLMTEHGLSNARLSKWVGLSRQIIGQYRLGRTLPSEQTLELLSKALQCDKDEFFVAQKRQRGGVMIPLAEWARRENIPVSRARNLFQLGLLSGAVRTEVGSMIVPERMHAPAGSKRAVRVAKVRPHWVPNFWTNFRVFLDQCRRDRPDIEHWVAYSAEVSLVAVYCWNNRVNYPKETRLPAIAAALGCTVAELIAPTMRQPEPRPKRPVHVEEMAYGWAAEPPQPVV